MASIEERVKKSFGIIKEEFEEHLDAINENTNEIQFNSEQIYTLGKKIDKLCQRMDDMELMLTHQPQMQEYDVCSFDKLSHMEKETFLLLFHKKNHTFKSLSARMAITEDQVKRSIANLIVKGVPIIKRYGREGMTLEIDHGFIMSQQKHNIMHMDSRLLIQ